MKSKVKAEVYFWRVDALYALRGNTFRSPVNLVFPFWGERRFGFYGTKILDISKILLELDIQIVLAWI